MTALNKHAGGATAADEAASAAIKGVYAAMIAKRMDGFANMINDISRVTEQ